MNLRSVSALFAMLLLVACGSTSLSKTGANYPPRQPKCDFEVFTSSPSGGFEEIGTIDIEPGGYGSNVHTDIPDLKEEIQPHVCQAGGDAVIAYANGYGMYIKASVLKRVAVPVAPVAAAPVAAPAAEAGCQYDTQCKGERVCVSGACVDPQPSAAPVAGATPPPIPAP